MNIHDKHAQSHTESQKNPRLIIRYTQHGPTTVRNPHYDPKACVKCGRRHSWMQQTCK